MGGIMSDTLMIVVAYKNIHLTQATIKGLRSQTASVDIVVWDNDSRDGTDKWLSQQTDLQCYNSSENVLWSPAINRAIEMFRKPEHQYLGFMNNDLVIPPQGLERMIALLTSSDRIGAVGPMGAGMGAQQDYASHIGVWPDSVDGWHGLNNHIANNAPKRVAFLVGALIMLPTKVWDDIGKLDEDMPLGADDHDYCIRLKEKDYELWVNTNIHVNHVSHATHGSPNWDVYGAKSWDVFNKKVAGYYRTGPEALLCHWGYEYHPGWEKGTGWLEDNVREPIYELRQQHHEQNLKSSYYREVYGEEWHGGF
jgi:GT2 family glycosyltransferase